MSHGDWKDMFRAIQANDTELVLFHIRNGVDINYQHPEYLTNALCESIRYRNENLVLLLLHNGASADIREMDTGKTPLEIAREIGFQSIMQIIETHTNQKANPSQNQKTNHMKATICTQYGPPEFLEIREVPKPTVKSNEILVKIMATTVNSGDVRVRELQVDGWMKIMMRLVIGWNKPRKPILGVTYAGIIEAMGQDVKSYNIGDQVFGLTAFKFGCHAEYVAVSEKSMILQMPKEANFDEAAAILFGGQTAICFLHKMGIQSKNKAKVLILGATGSVGTSAIQIAKYYGANVTAVCSSASQELCHSLDADKVIAYDQEDIYTITDRFDMILDAVGKYTKKQCKHLLNSNGIFKTEGGMEYASESIDQLELLSKIFNEGRLKPVIDKTFTLADIVEAHRYVDTGRKKGNVVVSMAV
jgi:NADPH:quinone reductase-like Zn-dependent oxidoreductase